MSQSESDASDLNDDTTRYATSDTFLTRAIPLTFTRSAFDVINTVGKLHIRQIIVARTPVFMNSLTAPIVDFANAYFTNPVTHEKQFFHLFALLVLEGTAKQVRIEKLETVSMKLVDAVFLCRTDTHCATMCVEPPGIIIDQSLNELLLKMTHAMGPEKFHNYNAIQNNCQDFIIALLSQATTTTIPLEMYKFIKQDLTQLDQLILVKPLKYAMELITDAANLGRRWLPRFLGGSQSFVRYL